jgi:hypothetical protein
MVFHAVRDAARLGDQEPILRGAPNVKRGDINDTDMRRLNLAVDRCDLAIRYEEMGRDADAMNTAARLVVVLPGDDVQAEFRQSH